MAKRKDPWPRCSEPGCGNAVREVAGDYPGKRLPELDGRCSEHRVEDTTYTAPEPEPIADVSQEVAPALDESPATVERIASLRDALRGDLLTSEVAELIREQLLEALRAAKTTFVTCPHCSHRLPVTLPDLATRVNATQRLVEELEGKLKAAEEGAQSRDERDAAELLRNIDEMSDEEIALEIVQLERQHGIRD